MALTLPDNAAVACMGQRAIESVPSFWLDGYGNANTLGTTGQPDVVDGWLHA